MLPSRLSILGVGLLGGSIGLAVRALEGRALAESALAGPEGVGSARRCRVVGYGHRRATLDKARQIGAVDEAREDVAEAVRGSDLVILCTPVGLFRSILQAIAPALRPGAVVTDVGSTKRSVVEAAGRLLPPGVHFVGSHPMAGSEKRGVEFARADLFHDALCLLTPTADTDPAALERVGAFWQAIGMRLAHLSPPEHDRLLADVSHLPHALAAALVTLQEDGALSLAGKGFLDTTRIAGGDGHLWRDIFEDNRDNLKHSIRALQRTLEDLVGLLDAGEGEALAAWLNAAAARREALPRRESRAGAPD